MFDSNALHPYDLASRAQRGTLKREYRFYLYILASISRRLYTGMTNDLHGRIWEHKEGKIEGFAAKYKINRLVYSEEFKYVKNCIDREKQVKAWTRAKRVALIESTNRTWEDLAEDWYKPKEAGLLLCSR